MPVMAPLAAILTTLLCIPDQAKAEPHVDVGLGTVAPVYLGAQVHAELPWRLLVSLEAGFMPSTYASFVNGIAQSFDAYNDETALIIEGALTGAFVFRPSIGYRPWEDLGLELMAGYTLLSFGQNVSGVDLIEDAIRRAPDLTGDEDVALASTLHAFHVTVAYAWQLAEHFSLRASIGYLQAVASSTSIEAPAIEARERDGFRLLATALDGYLDEKYTTYVKLPTLGLSASYRF